MPHASTTPPHFSAAPTPKPDMPKPDIIEPHAPPETPPPPVPVETPAHRPSEFPGKPGGHDIDEPGKTPDELPPQP